MESWFWIYAGSGWLVSLALVGVLARRCAPSEAWGWLTVMFALPWVGVAAYLLLGENPLGRRRVVRYREVIRRTGAGDVVEDLARHAAGDDLSGTASQIERLARAAGAPFAVGGNRADLLTGPEETAERLLDDIDRARRHINLDFYIFSDDGTGRRVADALARAADRGVRCRVLADAVGSYRVFLGLADELASRGVAFRPSLPINPLRRRLARIDVRNHRKIAVIDGRVAYLGSWNVVDADYGSDEISTTHDLSVRLSGPAALQVQLLFLEDWNFETDQPLGPDAFPPAEERGPEIVQALPSGPMYPSPSVRDLLVSAAHQADRRVVLTTPYFIPDAALLLSLRLAVRRGVQVDVSVPSHSDLFLVDAAGRSYARQLAAEGVNVYVHRDGVLHAKALTVDRAVGMVGSANFDIRSFRLNVEANLLVYSRDLIDALRARQDGYIGRSRRLEPGRAKAGARLKRLGEDVARLLSPLM